MSQELDRESTALEEGAGVDKVEALEAGGEASPQPFRSYSDEELKEFWELMVERSRSDQAVSGEPHAIFRIGMVKFALEAVSCSGVVPFTRAMPLPNLPTHVLGVASVRGNPVSVTDLRYLAGMGPSVAGKGGQLILVSHGSEETALLVDWVYNVKPLDLTQANEVALRKYGSVRDGLIEKVIERNGEEVLVLSAKACLKSG